MKSKVELCLKKRNWFKDWIVEYLQLFLIGWGTIALGLIFYAAFTIFIRYKYVGDFLGLFLLAGIILTFPLTICYFAMLIDFFVKKTWGAFK